MQHFTDACLAALRRVSTATLTTALFKRGLRNTFMHGVRPLARYPHNLVGPAFTLRNIPAREDIDRVEGSPTPSIRSARRSRPAARPCPGGRLPRRGARCLARRNPDDAAGRARRRRHGQRRRHP